MWIIKIFKIQCFYPARKLNEHWCIYSCLQIPPRENWFQYVRRVCAAAINFPCITTLKIVNQARNSMQDKLVSELYLYINVHHSTAQCKHSNFLLLNVLWRAGEARRPWATTTSVSVRPISFFLFRQPWATPISPSGPPHLTLSGKTTFLNGTCSL